MYRAQRTGLFGVWDNQAISGAQWVRKPSYCMYNTRQGKKEVVFLVFVRVTSVRKAQGGPHNKRLAERHNQEGKHRLLRT